MYTDLFDNSFWRSHPLRVLAILAMLKNKMAQNLTGSAIEMLQDLLNSIEAMVATLTIKIHYLGIWLDFVKNQYNIIVAKNAQITWSANNQIQSKLYNLFPVLCRLAKSSADYWLINCVTKLEAYCLHKDSADQCERRSFEEFHHHTIAALQRFLPGAPCQKQARRHHGVWLKLSGSAGQQVPLFGCLIQQIDCFSCSSHHQGIHGRHVQPTGLCIERTQRQQQQHGSFQPGSGKPGGNRF
jgi:hypothetical protein